MFFSLCFVVSTINLKVLAVISAISQPSFGGELSTEPLPPFYGASPANFSTGFGLVSTEVCSESSVNCHNGNCCNGGDRCCGEQCCSALANYACDTNIMKCVSEDEFSLSLNTVKHDLKRAVNVCAKPCHKLVR
jgi:hypothetical protein